VNGAMVLDHFDDIVIVGQFAFFAERRFRNA
jgi:hypothetical protein